MNIIKAYCDKKVRYTITLLASIEILCEALLRAPESESGPAQPKQNNQKRTTPGIR